ncbi:phage baseplate assembly protein V [Streptomyces sp. NPDC059468]|uniref:phage baseplate assembly protein V n=1 Tax=Streptomyces sp. NPDC059468 TaxID=3346845 RepID=UPI003696EC51
MSADPVLGMYRASVANNQDPLNEARVTLQIPQVLGNAESAWAVPASPTNTIPPVGQTVWVQFSGGDITKPVYSPLGIKNVQDQVSSGVFDTLPPKEPTALGLTTVQYVTAEGATQASVTATWTPPTENQDGTTLNDLAHYLVETSYDGSTWSSGTVTEDTLVVLSGLRTGVNFYVRVQAVDTSSNASLWATATIQTASSTTPPPVPSTPTVVGVLGGLRVTWNGLDSTGNPMPAIFDHVQVQRDVSNAFNSPTVVATLRGADFTYDSVQNYGSAYYYRLVAYSRVGIASSPSGYASDTPKQAGTGDIAVNSVTANQMATGTITAESGIISSIDGDRATITNIGASSIKADAINTSHLALGAVTGNLITNGSFEDTSRAGWTFSQSSASDGFPKIEIAQGGSPSRSGSGKGVVGASGSGWAKITSDSFPVVAGSTYMFRYWYQGTGHLMVTFETSPDGTTWTDQLAASNDVTSSSSTYTEDFAEVTIPTGAVWGRVSFKNNNPAGYGYTSGQYWLTIDDVVVVREGYGAVDITPGGVRLYDQSGNLNTELNSANSYATFAGGAASINPLGNGTFNSIWTPQRPAGAASDDPTGQIWYQGQELGSLLWNMPWGMVTYERGWTNKPTSTTYYTTDTGLIELAFTAVEGRMYRIVARSQFDFNGGTGNQVLENRVTVAATATSLNGCTVWSPTGASPTVSDPIMARCFGLYYDGAGTDGTTVVEGLIVCSSDGGGNYGATTCLAPGDHRILWVGTQHAGNATGWGLRNYIPAQSSDFYVEDIGPAVHEGGVYNTGGAAVTATKTYTKTYNATWSIRFGNAGSTTGTVYQGNYSSTWGQQKSMVGFGTQPYTDMGSTAKVSKVEIYLYNQHWYYNAGGTAHIGVHTQTNQPGSFTMSGSLNTSVANWPVGAGKWVTLPSSWNSGWNSGSPYRGITLGGDLSTTDKTYYGYFDGVGGSHPPQLRITYTK